MEASGGGGESHVARKKKVVRGGTEGGEKSRKKSVKSKSKSPSKGLKKKKKSSSKGSLKVPKRKVKKKTSRKKTKTAKSVKSKRSPTPDNPSDLESVASSVVADSTLTSEDDAESPPSIADLNEIEDFSSDDTDDFTTDDDSDFEEEEHIDSARTDPGRPPRAPIVSSRSVPILQTRQRPAMSFIPEERKSSFSGSTNTTVDVNTQRKYFQEQCQHKLNGFRWTLIPMIQNKNPRPSFDSGSGLRVAAYDPTFKPQVFVFPIKSFTPSGRSATRKLLLSIDPYGENITYLDSENVYMRKRLRRVRVVPDEEAANRFVLIFDGDYRSYSHQVYAERYRDELLEILRLASSEQFSNFDLNMVCIHEGRVQTKASRWSTYSNRYLRLMNGRLLIYRTPESRYPTDAFVISSPSITFTKNIMRIQTAERKVTIKVQSVEECDLWREAFYAAKTRASIERQELAEQNKRLHKFDEVMAKFPRPSPERTLSSSASAPINLPITSRDLEAKQDDPLPGIAHDDWNRRPSKKGFEVFSIVSGRLQQIPASVTHWDMVFVYVMEKVVFPEGVISGSNSRANVLLHINLAAKCVQYYHSEKLLLERSLANAQIAVDRKMPTAFGITLTDGDSLASIEQCVEDPGTLEELINLLCIVVSPKFDKLHIPIVTIYKGSCEIRGKAMLWWNYRYLVLINGRLFIYQSAQSTVPLAVYSLINAQMYTDSSNRIICQSGRKKVVMRFINYEERDTWWSVFQKSTQRGEVERRALVDQRAMLSSADTPDVSRRLSATDQIMMTQSLTRRSETHSSESDHQASVSLPIADTSEPAPPASPAHESTNLVIKKKKHQDMHELQMPPSGAAVDGDSPNSSVGSSRSSALMKAATTKKKKKMPRSSTLVPESKTPKKKKKKRKPVRTPANALRYRERSYSNESFSSAQSDGGVVYANLDNSKKKKKKTKTSVSKPALVHKTLAQLRVSPPDSPQESDSNRDSIQPSPDSPPLMSPITEEENSLSSAPPPPPWSPPSDSGISPDHASPLSPFKHIHSLEQQRIRSLIHKGSYRRDGSAADDDEDDPNSAVQMINEMSSLLNDVAGAKLAQEYRHRGSVDDHDSVVDRRKRRWSIGSNDDLALFAQKHGQTDPAPSEPSQTSTSDPRRLLNSSSAEEEDMKVYQAQIVSHHEQPMSPESDLPSPPAIPAHPIPKSLDEAHAHVTPGGPDGHTTPGGPGDTDLTEYRIDLIPKNKVEATPVGFIEMKDPFAPLEDVRQLIVTELDQIPEVFAFVRHGVPIGLRQESKKDADYASVDEVITIKEFDHLDH